MPVSAGELLVVADLGGREAMETRPVVIVMLVIFDAVFKMRQPLNTTGHCNPLYISRGYWASLFLL